MKIHSMLWMIAALFACPSLPAQVDSLYEACIHHGGNQTLPYRIMLPANFNKSEKYPVLFFFHGAGERGTDNEKQLVHGAAFFSSEEARSKYPAIVVFPQCPENQFWANVKIIQAGNSPRKFEFDPSAPPTEAMRLSIDLIHTILHEKWVDRRRVYVGGLSMGGMATYELLNRLPKVFAAAFPICGAGNPDKINPASRKTKIWAFHGALDKVVLPQYSEQMIAAYKALRFNATLTIYPEVGHNAWDYSFREPGLLPWIFSSQR